MVEEKTYEGLLGISRLQPSDMDRPIHLSLRDELSGSHFLEIELSLEDLALALTGRADTPCNFTFYSMEQVGKVREGKDIVIPFTSTNSEYGDTREARQREKEEALAPYEVDGWIGSISDIGNHHRLETVQGVAIPHFRVSFHRYVDPSSEEEKGE